MVASHQLLNQVKRLLNNFKYIVLSPWHKCIYGVSIPIMTVKCITGCKVGQKKQEDSVFQLFIDVFGVETR